MQLTLRDWSHKNDKSVIVYSPAYQSKALLSSLEQKKRYFKSVFLFIQRKSVGSRLVLDSNDFHYMTRQSSLYPKKSHTGLGSHEGE